MLGGYFILPHPVEQRKNISLAIVPRPNTTFNSTIWAAFYVAVRKNVGL